MFGTQHSPTPMARVANRNQRIVFIMRFFFLQNSKPCLILNLKFLQQKQKKMNSILPNQERARWAVIIFYLHLLAVLSFAGASWWQADIIESGDLEHETAALSDIIVGFSALAYVGSFVATIVVFIMWFRRAYANLHRLESPKSILSYQEGWAAGAWFVPFINLVRPYTIMKELWNETQDNIAGKVQRDGLQSSAIIGWWWAAWLIYNIVGRITDKVGNDTDVEGIIQGLRSNTIGLMFALPAGILAILIIKKVSAFEQELYEGQQMNDPSEHLLAE